MQQKQPNNLQKQKVEKKNSSKILNKENNRY